MKQIGFAIVGSGAAARLHAQALQMTKDAGLIGIYSADAAGAELLAKEFGVRRFESWEAMAECPQVEVLNICTPSGTHAELAIRAMECGKHVMVEKPLALNPEDCARVVETAAQSGRLCATFAQLRFFEQVRSVKRAIDEGWLGKVVLGSVSMKYHRTESYYAASEWRGTKKMDGGGALMNQGIHGVDLLRYFMGEVKQVSAVCRTLHHRIEVEDTAVAVLEYQSGAIGTVEATTSVYPGKSRLLELCGTKGSIRLEENQITRWDVEGHPCPVSEQGVEMNGSADPNAISALGHCLQIDNMARAVRGEEPLENDAESGRRSVELICAIYEASEKGSAVTL